MASSEKGSGPWRMIVRGGFQDAWSAAPQTEKNEVFRAWIEVQRGWIAHGCALIATLDDELSMAGQPRARLWNFYSLWEVPDPAVVHELLTPFRTEEAAAIRLDKYFSVETVVGMPIRSLERAVGLAPASLTE